MDMQEKIDGDKNERTDFISREEAGTIKHGSEKEGSLDEDQIARLKDRLKTTVTPKVNSGVKVSLSKEGDNNLDVQGLGVGAPQVMKVKIPFPNMYGDVARFQSKFGQLVAHQPRHLTLRKLQERIMFMQEELNEFAFASTMSIHGVSETLKEQDLALQADALVDLVYVALGTAVMMGLPWTHLWDDVHRANMAKVPGTTHRGNLVDVCKPEGWEGPKTLHILVAAGYNRDLNKEELYADDEIYMQANHNI